MIVSTELERMEVRKSIRQEERGEEKGRKKENKKEREKESSEEEKKRRTGHRDKTTSLTRLMIPVSSFVPNVLYVIYMLYTVCSNVFASNFLD